MGVTTSELEHKLSGLLHHIEQMASQVNQLSSEKILRYFPLQEPQFNTNSTEPMDYVKELMHDFSTLQTLLAQPAALSVIDYQCQQVTTKAKQLHFALSTLIAPSVPTRKNSTQRPYRKAHSRTSYLYQKLTQQKEYERRLNDKIQQRKVSLTKPGCVAYTIQQEIDVLQQRLERCKQATYEIETAILKHERQY